MASVVDTNKNTHTYPDKSDFKKPGAHWRVPGLKINHVCEQKYNFVLSLTHALSLLTIGKLLHMR